MITSWNKDAKWAEHHYAVTPSDTVDNPIQGPIRCGSAGDIVVVDNSGVALTYTVVAGEVIPVKIRRVNATGTTVTGIIGFW